MSSPDPSDDQKSVLNCIKTQFQKRKSGDDVFEAYKSFCQFLGDDVMEYNEFDFWWYRFKEGNFDLNYDRSKDPKKPGLSDIPLDLIEEIIGKMKWKERCIFRKVSKKCKEIVDDQAYTFESVRFVQNMSESTLEIDGSETIYSSERLVSLEIRNEEHILCDNHEKVALEDLLLILKNPNVCIKLLRVYISCWYRRGIVKTVLKSLSHQIHVECYEYEHFYENLENDDLDNMQDNVMIILPYLKPKVLQCLIFECEPRELTEKKYIMYEIVKLEQWKQARKLEVYTLLSRFYLKDLKNFTEIKIYIEDTTLEDVICLKEVRFVAPL